MALKRGPVMPGAEAYVPAYVVPALLGVVDNTDAAGADVPATLWLPNGVDTGIAAVDQGLAIDYRIFFIYWDKAWTGGNLTVKPVANGSVVGAHNKVITPQAGPGYTYQILAPGSMAIGHGDTSGFRLSCAAGFTCVGNLSVMVFFSGAAHVQPDFKAWTPS